MTNRLSDDEKPASVPENILKNVPENMDVQVNQHRGPLIETESDSQRSSAKQDSHRLTEFVKRLKEIGTAAHANTGMADYRHMRKVQALGHMFFAFGILILLKKMVYVSAIFIAVSLMVRWLLMHHIGHGGYDRIPNIPSAYHSKRYALGWRRYVDWFDWLKPEAWNFEHNYLHHYFTGEDKDPDLVEKNLIWLAQARRPLWMKYLILLFFAATWKFTYYSARTLSYLKGYNEITFFNFFDLRKRSQRVMWFELFLPYVVFHYFFISLVLNALVPGMGALYLQARIIAEVLHNVHTFLVIIPNHSGPDVYRYPSVDPLKRGGSSYYLRQILGSANFSTGSEWVDFSQMYLNYQIEHHLFPTLSMLQYRIIQPKVKALCAEYRIPYIQENVFVRFFKMTQIATGQSTMKCATAEFDFSRI